MLKILSHLVSLPPQKCLFPPRLHRLSQQRRTPSPGPVWTSSRRMSDSAPAPITAPPAEGQVVAHNGRIYETVREGLAYILVPPNTQKMLDPQAQAGEAKMPDLKPQNVFYNPIQQFNRDLSVLSIKAFGRDYMRRRKLRQGASTGKKNKKTPQKRKISEVSGGETAYGEDGLKLRDALDGTDDPLEEDRAKFAPQDARGGVENQSDVLLKAQDTGSPQRNGADGDDLKTNASSNCLNEKTKRSTSVDVDTNGPGIHAEGEASRQIPPRFRILDALSATGLRALRYAKEIPFVSSVVANDMNPNATKNINVNVQHNDLSTLISTNTGDAIGHMYSVAYPPPSSHGPSHVNRRYDVVDLDPYGTAVPFLDAALQSLNDGGLLCVTCTDSGVFASCGYSEKTFALYGGMPVKGSHMHEGGLRLIVHVIASTAAKYGLAIEPLLSLSIDYYVRVFIRVRKSPADVKFSAAKTMLVYGCDAGCGAWTVQRLGRNAKQTGKDGNPWFKHSIAQAPSADRLCEHCGHKTHVAGPMWGGPLHNGAFIERVLAELDDADPTVYATKARIEGMLTTALDELAVNRDGDGPIYVQARDETCDKDPGGTVLPGASPVAIPRVSPGHLDQHPFFVIPSALAKVIHCVAPSHPELTGALRYAGFRATRSHCQPGSIKTQAPWSVIWEIMREWTRQRHPIKDGKLRPGTPGWNIMHPAAEAAREARTGEPSKKATADAAAAGDHVNDEPVDPMPVDHPPGAAQSAGGASKRKIVFDEALGRDPPGKRLVRYQQNPRENWGPMARAKGPA